MQNANNLSVLKTNTFLPQVGSRIVIQVGGIILIILGCLGKFGGLFLTIPEPVIGGMFIVMFGLCSCHFLFLFSIVVLLLFFV